MPLRGSPLLEIQLLLKVTPYKSCVYYYLADTDFTLFRNKVRNQGGHGDSRFSGHQCHHLGDVLAIISLLFPERSSKSPREGVVLSRWGLYGMCVCGGGERGGEGEAGV